MKLPDNATRAEIELYCGLLRHAYALMQEQTGLVCGTTAESMRDAMFSAIMNTGSAIAPREVQV